MFTKVLSNFRLFTKVLYIFICSDVPPNIETFTVKLCCKNKKSGSKDQELCMYNSISFGTFNCLFFESNGIALILARHLETIISATE